MPSMAEPSGYVPEPLREHGDRPRLSFAREQGGGGPSPVLFITARKEKLRWSE